MIKTSNHIDAPDVKLFCGTSHPELGKEISDYLGIPLGNLKISRFSCGEVYVRILENVRGSKVYVIQTGSASVDQDLMELFILIDAFKRASAESVNVIIPHFPYARQDRKSASREPISARMVANLLTALGVDRIITMDLHADQIQGFFDIPVDHLTAIPLFADYFKRKKLKDVVVVAPDTGRARTAKRLADRLSAPLAILHKRRPEQQQSEVTHVIGEVQDRTVIVFDDMIDTGGTATQGIAALMKQGARSEVYLAATHPVLSGPATQRLKQAGLAEIVVSNTIPIPASKQLPNLKILHAGPLLAESIRRNYLNQSVSSLFD